MSNLSQKSPLRSPSQSGSMKICYRTMDPYAYADEFPLNMFEVYTQQRSPHTDLKRSHVDNKKFHFNRYPEE